MSLTPRFAPSRGARAPRSAIAQRVLASSLAAASALLLTAAPASAKPAFDSNTFGALKARSIGPAVMSGRIASLDAVATDPLTLFVGTASGGIWRSRDGGTRFEPIFDEHTQSIGAVRVAPSDPSTVWAGTGESWVRNSVSYGDGVYKSTDGGDTWKRMGLEQSERIAAIRIHPEDPETVYVCALGALFADHEERGVYKTTDGGESWKQVLAVDSATGCADLDLDPQEPDIVYAAMWQVRRWAYFFESGGPGSGLFRSRDGGETWEELRNGLPEGDLGRIAVAVSPSRPNVVYATVEAEENALYRSDDLGASFRQTNASQNVQMRPFYFSELVIDPVDHQRVYTPGFTLTTSIDGGESFSSILGGGFSFSVHPDHHALWINPQNPHELILGTDGGVYISYDRAVSWNHVKTLPVSQFYQVAADNQVPYNVYGGLQDNGSWFGPSRASGGVSNADWRMLSFGDGFWVLPDPSDDEIAFSEIQGGRLLRAHKRFGTAKSIFPYSTGEQEKLRFNWNTPMHFSPSTPGTLYYGSQFLHRSRDRGETWETLSPDLTTDDPAKQRQSESGGLTVDNSTAENHCTIYTISESPVDPKVLWVGTDDGNIQLTRDGGATWNLVSAHLPEDLAPHPWVTSVSASPHEAGTAFVTLDYHWQGDMAPHVYLTTDFGATWRSLVSEEIEGYAHVIEQDPVNPDLLYLGTELGLFLSLDSGASWAPFRQNLPRVAVHDVFIHPADQDLVIATHGRGIYILDDLTPLRALTTELLEQDVALLPSRPAEMTIGAGAAFGLGSDDEFVGSVPPEAASITYHLKKRHLFGDLKIEIRDPEGALLATLPGGKRRGLNRVDWPMRFKAPKLPAATNLVPAFIGPRVAEGTYSVRLIKGKKTVEGEIQLVPDRRNPYSGESRATQQKVALELYDGLEQLAFLAAQLENLRDGAAALLEEKRLRSRERGQVEALGDQAESLRASLVSTAKGGMLSGDEKLREQMGTLYGDISTYDGAPTSSQLGEGTRLLAELSAADARVEALIEQTLGPLNSRLEKRGQKSISTLERETWMAENTGRGASASVFLSSKRSRAELHGLLGASWLGF
ncbi:MAG: glycosyl hydrolase [Acidobacteriota bacterium]